MPEDYRCGYITIIGRPNVGKSTLLNNILGQKISIVSDKPQTTRWHLTGIKTESDYQAIYVDTPGVQYEYKDAINRYMMREVMNSLSNVDILIFMIESMKWTDADERILKLIKPTKIPTMLVINKVDKIKSKQKLLPFIEKISSKSSFINVVPLSARKNTDVKMLENTVRSLLPFSAPVFPEDQLTDRNERFLAAEYVREKLTRKLGDELPYSISVTIEKFEHKQKSIHIHALIWVDGESQKSIVIGKGGNILKSVGEQARKDMENLFKKKVFLKTWVKVKKKWTDDLQALKQFGYEH